MTSQKKAKKTKTKTKMKANDGTEAVDSGKKPGGNGLMPGQPVYQFKMVLNEAMGLIPGKESLSDKLNQMWTRGYFLSGMCLLRLKKPTLYIVVSQMFDPGTDDKIQESEELREPEIV